MGEDKLKNKDLSGAITQMKKFNARRRLRAAVDAVKLANRMKHFGLGASKKHEAETDISEGATDEHDHILPEHITGPVIKDGVVIA